MDCIKMVVTMNPCKCGYYPDRNLCRCSELDISRHIGKLSRPFLDRFDLTVHVDKPTYDEISAKDDVATMDDKTTGFTSKEMKEKVKNAICMQNKRYSDEGIKYNSELSAAQVRKYCVLDEECDLLMKKAYEKFDLSARGYNKILKVARTIADLDAEENICVRHLSEAICFRNMQPGGENKLG